MAVNIDHARKGSMTNSKNMNLIVKSRKITNKLVPVNKRAISKRKGPYNIKKKYFQLITCK